LMVVFQGWRERAVAFAVSAVGIGATWSHYIEIPGQHDVLLSLVHDGLMVVFLAFAVAVILSNIFAGGAITADGVRGAVCGYLLAAMLWANAYALTETLVPDSFSLSSPALKELATWHGRHALFNYFSVVTLTTMGYGDITPVRPPATALAMLEAVFGQFYIAVVVAQLVGLRLAHALGPTR